MMRKIKGRNFSIRLSDHEYGLIQEHAELDRRSMADFMRLATFDKIAAGNNDINITVKRSSGGHRTTAA
jgi:uncharacterized protein (DUF1778 family)